MSKEIRELEAQLGELRGICRLWMAANDAKGARIAELEEETRRLRQRVARLGRMAAHGPGRPLRRRANNG